MNMHFFLNDSKTEQEADALTQFLLLHLTLESSQPSKVLLTPI